MWVGVRLGYWADGILFDCLIQLHYFTGLMRWTLLEYNQSPSEGLILVDKAIDRMVDLQLISDLHKSEGYQVAESVPSVQKHPKVFMVLLMNKFWFTPMIYRAFLCCTSWCSTCEY